MTKDEERLLNSYCTDPERAAQAVSNYIYNLSNSLFESLEHRRLISGNGHHMAQELAAYAKQMVMLRAMV